MTTSRPAQARIESTDNTVERLARELAAGDTSRTSGIFAPEARCLHPDADRIEATSVTWALSHRLVAEERGLPRLRASRVGRLVARAMYDAPAAIVQIASDWTVLFCLLDDWLESHSEEGATAEIVDALTRPRSITAEPGPVSACADIYGRLSAIASEAWLARWRVAVTRLFDAFGREVGPRASAAPVMPRTYAAIRTQTSGIPLLLVIHELAHGDITEPAPLVATLEERAGRLVGYANDLFTFRREVASGEVMNLVTVVAHQERATLGDAVERAASVHDEEAAHFYSLAARMLNGRRSTRHRARAAAARSWVMAHNAWARETGRYDG
ncbi:MAG: terpene synthase family protein [Polyangiaceae bacterium]